MTRTILLADDSVTIQKVVELTFMDQDYEIVAVSDGSAAVAKLPDLKPDLLIADVHMPGADGYEVCRRSKDIYPDVPVLLLVGTFEHFDEAAAAAAGAESHLKKPFDSQDLLHQVEALISRSGRQAGSDEEPSEVMDLDPPSLTGDEVTSVSEAAFELEEDTEPEPAAGTPFPLSAAEEAPSAEAPPAEPTFEDAWGTADSGTPMVASPLLGGSQEPAPPPVADESPAAEPSFEDPWGVEAAPAAEPPAAEAASEAVTVQTPAFEEPPIEPAAEAPVADTQAVETPFAEPAFEAPAFEAPAFEEPSFEEPSFEAPAFEEPSFEEPSFEAPAFEEPPAAAAPAEPAAEEPPAEEPPPAEAVAEEEDEPVAAAPASGDNGLSDDDVDRIARRMVELAGDTALREVAWEVVPDLAEVIIKERIRELESQVE